MSVSKIGLQNISATERNSKTKADVIALLNTMGGTTSKSTADSLAGKLLDIAGKSKNNASIVIEQICLWVKHAKFQDVPKDITGPVEYRRANRIQNKYLKAMGVIAVMFDKSSKYGLDKPLRQDICNIMTHIEENKGTYGIASHVLARVFDLRHGIKAPAPVTPSVEPPNILPSSLKDWDLKFCYDNYLLQAMTEEAAKY